MVESEVVTHKYYCFTLLLQGMIWLTLEWDQQWWRVRWSPTSTLPVGLINSLLQVMSCLTLGWDQQWWRVR